MKYSATAIERDYRKFGLRGVSGHPKHPPTPPFTAHPSPPRPPFTAYTRHVLDFRPGLARLLVHLHEQSGQSD